MRPWTLKTKGILIFDANYLILLKMVVGNF